MDIANVVVAKVGPSVYALSAGAPATALARFAVSVQDSAVAMDFTADDTEVLRGDAFVGNVNRLLFCEGDFRIYKIVGFVFNTSYTLDRPYAGPTGTHDTVIFSPVSGVSGYGQSGGVWGE